MNQEKPSPFLEALADGIGCISMIVLVISIIGLGIYAQIGTLTREVESSRKWSILLPLKVK
jgi:hypothetical protein